MIILLFLTIVFLNLCVKILNDTHLKKVKYILRKLVEYI